MKRIAIAMTGATLLVLALTAPATADYPPSPTHTESPSVGPTQTESPSVLGETVTVSPGTGGTAFTGSNVTAPLALGGILLAVGLALLYLSRRRAATDDR